MTPENNKAQPVRLLVTKIYVPQARTALVQRERLLALLNASALRRLAVVSAPAGFGKTTLLATWASQSGMPVGWVSLDAADNDPVRFWAYVVAAARQVKPGVGEDALAVLRSPQPPAVEALLSGLINDLTTVPGPFALVLDDYHVISTPAIHEGIAFLIEHMPPPMHLMLASRSDPDLPLALWRARDEMLEVGAADLRFTPEECTAFFLQVMGLTLPKHDIATLDERTEGWVAGLQLAALSMQGISDKAGFVEAFSGSHRYVVDYLAQEILNRQPERVRSFLLQTSVLERLSGPLCDALTGRDDGQATLEGLERAHLFVIPLDQERRWYRYHHLFGEFLRARLEQTEPAAIANLQRRASDWCWRQGFTPEAVSYALAASDFELAASRIEDVMEELFKESELTTLCGWLDMVPAEVVHARPRLTMVYAWAALATGRPDVMEEQLQAIERSPQADDAGTRGEIEVLRASAAVGRQDLAGTQQHAQQAVRLLEGAGHGLWNDLPSLRGVAAFDQALAYEMTGNTLAAHTAYAEAVRLNREARNAHLAPLCISRLALMQELGGQLYQAADTYRQALNVAKEMSAHPSPLAGVAYTGLGGILCEWNDLEGAEKNLQAGVAMGELWRNWDSLLPGYQGLARVRMARGDIPGALAMLDRLEASAPAAIRSIALPVVDALRARVWLRNDATAAEGWQQSCGLGLDAAPSYMTEALYLIRARVCVALGDQVPDVRPLLERMQAGAEAGGRAGRAIEILMLKALALQAQGKTAQAAAALEQSLTLAEPGGYVRLYADEGQTMAGLLAQVKAPALAAYVRKLAAACRQPPPGTTAVPGLAEPLSEREQEVLALLAQGLSNQQIASQLVVSPNTVKTHVKNIYEKLGVNSRTQAVARAREFGLV